MGTDITLYVEQRHHDGEWRMLRPPARDLTRWPLRPEEIAGADYDWGPDQCMWTRRCAGFEIQVDENEASFIQPGETLPELRARLAREFPKFQRYQDRDHSTCPDCLGTGFLFEWFHQRHYATYSVLADVRNGGSITPISPPRGMPPGTSAAVENAMCCDVGVSWLTLDEIEDYPHWGSTSWFGMWTDMRDEDHLRIAMANFDDAASRRWRHVNVDVRLATYELIIERARALAVDVREFEARHSVLRTIVRSVTLREACSTFLTFIEQIVKPAITLDDYQNTRAVYLDAVEDGSPHLAMARSNLRAMLRETESHVRFIFGFNG